MPDHKWRNLGLELLVVVVGILLALGVDRLNQQRLDRLQEREYLVQLSADLETDLSTLDDVVEQATGHRDAALTVLDVVARGPSSIGDRDAFAWQINYATFIYFFFPTESTYRELTSTGGLAVLRDDALRRNVIAYYEGNERLAQYHDVWKATSWDRLQPAYQELLAPSDWRLIATTQRIDGALPVERPGEIDVDEVVARLGSSEHVQNLLSTVVVNSTQQIGAYGSRREEAEALLAQIKRVLR